MEKLKYWVLNNFYWFLCGLIVVFTGLVLLSALHTRRIFYENELQKVQGQFYGAIGEWHQKNDYDARVLSTMAEAFRGVNWSDSLTLMGKISRLIGKREIYHNFGIVDAKGCAYLANGLKFDVSKEPAFRNALMGKTSAFEIVNVSVPGLAGQTAWDITPIYDSDNSVKGALFGFFSRDDDGDMVNISYMEKILPCLITDTAGEVHFVNKAGVTTNNLFLEILNDNPGTDGQNIVEAIEKDMEHNISDRMHCVLGIPGTLFYSPVMVSAGGTYRYFFCFLPDYILSQSVTADWVYLKDYIFFGTIIILSLIAGVTLLYQHFSNRVEVLSYTSDITGGDNLRKLANDLMENKWNNFCVSTIKLEGYYGVMEYRPAGEMQKLLVNIWTLLQTFSGDRVKFAHYSGDIFFLAAQASQEEMVALFDRITEQINKFVSTSGVGHIQPYFVVDYVESLDKELVGVMGPLISKSQIFDFAGSGTNYVFVNKDISGLFSSENDVGTFFEKTANEHRIRLMYRPQFDLAGNLVSARSVVKWLDEQGQEVQTDAFLDLMRRNGYLNRLDSLNLRSLCIQERQWQVQGKVLVPVTLRISVDSFYEKDLVRQFTTILELAGVDPKYITLELVDQELLTLTDVREVVQGLRKANFNIAISSSQGRLGILTKFDPGTIGTFTMGSSILSHGVDVTAKTIIGDIVDTIRKLGIKVGFCDVDTEDLHNYVTSLGYDEISGNTVGEILSGENFEKLLKAGSKA